MRLTTFAVLGLLSAGLGGCARTPQPEVRVDPAVTNEVLASAARQIRTCYRNPRVLQSARQIATRIAIKLNADGSLAELPTVVGQTGITSANSLDAPRMAEAASLAIIRCSPLSLPAQHYPLIWQNIELTFSPVRRV